MGNKFIGQFVGTVVIDEAIEDVAVVEHIIYVLLNGRLGAREAPLYPFAQQRFTYLLGLDEVHYLAELSLRRKYRCLHRVGLAFPYLGNLLSFHPIL